MEATNYGIWNDPLYQTIPVSYTHLASRSGYATRRPGPAPGRSGHAVSRPGYAAGRSGHSVRRPGHAASAPGHAACIPGRAVGRSCLLYTSRCV